MGSASSLRPAAVTAAAFLRTLAQARLAEAETGPGRLAEPDEIADALVEHLDAQGVIVVIEAEHMCMSMRGISKPGSSTVTSALRGIMSDGATRAEMMALVLSGSR